MKTSLLLPALLLAALPASLHAAPGTVNAVLQEIADGVPGGMPSGSLAANGNFGTACAPLGDLDGDGLPELAAGAAFEDAVYLLFLNGDGTVRRHVRIANGSGGLTTAFTDFGTSCAALGDLDGNGVPDLAVGAPKDNTGFSTAGALYVLFLNPDGTMGSFEKIAHGERGFPTGLLEGGDFFGQSCASLGDLDGDGLPELAVGALFDDTDGPDRGAV
jgi:hypothetical protein